MVPNNHTNHTTMMPIARGEKPRGILSGSVLLVLRVGVLACLLLVVVTVMVGPCVSPCPCRPSLRIPFPLFFRSQKAISVKNTLFGVQALSFAGIACLCASVCLSVFGTIVVTALRPIRLHDEIRAHAITSLSVCACACVCWCSDPSSLGRLSFFRCVSEYV